MSHREDLTRYTANFIDELHASGVTDIVISPGSRSTPLAMTVLEHPQLKEWIIVDERSAGFFALGMAKERRRPVALLCTSGTAAANYYPAIIEAYYSRVPLIVLTTDRPHELRDVGAPQAINQIRLFGDYPKWFHEMALPESSPGMLGYARSNAAKAVTIAQQNNAGPVHLNFPFREPLVPDFSLLNLWETPDNMFHPVYDGVTKMNDQMRQAVLEKIKGKKRGVIVCGPQLDKRLAESIVSLAEAWKLPVLADPLSQLRSGNHSKSTIVEGYDAFFRDETIRESLKPDFILRFGAMPISKSYLFYAKENKTALQFVVDDKEDFRDPTGNPSAFIYSDGVLFCRDVLQSLPKLPHIDSQWLPHWQSINDSSVSHLNSAMNDDLLTEGVAVQQLLTTTPDNSSLYVGNSMAIRDVDTFFFSTDKHINILANRGANGIDGMVSSGVGAAANSKKRVTLLLGDLSFYHDLNGLLAAKHYTVDLTILLINNNGGGIFSFLPQAKEAEHFERLFGTPLGINFQPVIEMYGGVYDLATTVTELKSKLEKSYQTSGLSVIEVKTERASNQAWHSKLWKQIHYDILKKIEEEK